MNIYIKPKKKVSVYQRERITVKDVAQVFTEKSLGARIEKIELIRIKDKGRRNYLVSVMDIVEAIDKAFPGHSISNLGEIDTIVDYSPKPEKEKMLINVLKLAFVCLVLISGSATAIMSFHSEAQIPLVFENLYFIFFGQRVQNPMIIDLPYSIGLAVGIIVFFNHFSGKKLTNDPTPIEVELSTYEMEVTDNVIDALNAERDKNGNS